MATLTGQQIDGSYQGLIKTTDNGAISGTAKAVTDGLGNATNIEISNTATNFVSGTVDFTGSTISGLPTSSAGLENGTGADSLQSAASLTTTAANASDSGSIALGNGAISSGNNGNAIGANSECKAVSGTAIGNNSQAGANPGEFYSIAIGNNCTAGDSSVVIGNSINGLTTAHAVGIGNTGSIAFRSIAIGRLAGATGSASVSIGNESDATATNSVALGNGVQATTADTVSVKALETQTDSTPTAGGIIMSDAGGTDRRINIDASGGLQIDSTPVGGGGGGSTSHPARYFGTGNLVTTFEGPYTFFTNDILFYAVHLEEGEEITELAVEVGTAFVTTTTLGMALYDTQLGSSTVQYVPNNKLLDLGTVNPSTTGVKTFTGSTYTATYSGMYMIALGYNGQWDGTFRQTESTQRTYNNYNFFTNNTTLGFAVDKNVAEPIRYGGYGGTMPASFAASQSFNNTSARLALMGKTAQNI